MLKKINFVCCILVLFLACNEEKTYRIKVNLTNLSPQDVYAVFESADSKSVDTVSYNGKGTFVITQKQDNYRTLTLYYDNFLYRITIFLEKPQQIIVSGNAQYPLLVHVKGGHINESLSNFYKETAPLLREYYMLSDNGDAVPEIQTGSNRVARLANINNDLRIQVEAFIRNNPDDETSAILIRDYFIGPDNTHQIDNLLELLNPDLNDFYVVQDLKAYTEKAKQTAIGSKAPDFNVKNIEGSALTVRSFTNRYFLLAFTSMWSDLCHTNELHLDEIIASFPKDSLCVLLVSLDENPREVRDIIRKEKTKWNIVTDSAGQAIQLLDLYNVNVLPRCFLIDKEGNIILKTDNGVEIKKVMEQLIQ